MVQDALEDIFGDYRYTTHELSFIRSDPDPKFIPLRGWLNLIGLRYYVAPANTKTTRAERGIRAIKELVRIILESLTYIMPYKWIPNLVEEATLILTLQFKSKLGMTPYEAFYNQEISFKEINKYRFGNIISYTNVTTSSSVFKPRVRYGAIIGRNISGNLLVENLDDKLSI